jgi:hypothetical protein
MPKITRPLIDRLLAKVNVDPDTGCWIWNGYRAVGYGQIRRGRRGTSLVGTHVAAYEHFVGPVPDGLELDHLCKTPPCCNPRHLEAVTHAENLRRSDIPSAGGRAMGAIQKAKTQCPKGHEYTDGNTIICQGKRVCRACKNRRASERYIRIRESKGFAVTSKYSSTGVP